VHVQVPREGLKRAKENGSVALEISERLKSKLLKKHVEGNGNRKNYNES